MSGHCILHPGFINPVFPFFPQPSPVFVRPLIFLINLSSAFLPFQVIAVPLASISRMWPSRCHPGHERLDFRTLLCIHRD
jgi:hypothetical protein